MGMGTPFNETIEYCETEEWLMRWVGAVVGKLVHWLMPSTHQLAKVGLNPGWGKMYTLIYAA